MEFVSTRSLGGSVIKVELHPKNSKTLLHLQVYLNIVGNLFVYQPGNGVIFSFIFTRGGQVTHVINPV